MKKFPDLKRLGQKFERERANLQDVIRVYQVVLALPGFLETLQNAPREYEDLIKMTYYGKFKEYLDGLSKLQALVETTVDLRAADHHEYVIKAEFHPELKEIRSRMDDITVDIQKLARQVAIDLDLEFEKKLKYEHNSQYGHHLRLSRNVSLFSQFMLRMQLKFAGKEITLNLPLKRPAYFLRLIKFVIYATLTAHFRILMINSKRML